MKVAIILNGQIENIEFFDSILENYNYIICADGGANKLYKIGKKPNVIIGDLDSIHDHVKNYYRKNNVDFKKFPSKKDKTDTEIAIDYAISIGATQIDFIGALGDRMDHTLANINCLYYLLKRKVDGKIVDENSQIYITDKEKVIYGEIGDIVSIIPCFSDAKGVTLEGFEYTLEDFNLEFGCARGISNVMLSPKCIVKVKQGCLLIIKYKKRA
ncbi:thiamine pyrophosphokinase [Alkalithermobacter thermoalcaliphilus JW-YL-7 = DSM 7308]|uniref:Thiamine diphosphokinase n=1 Tax=Alkalithermobacter thermoalcaliphilus JW-YL-7 = DSM 7308 TaxID=1121328 RepID=A0A150FPX1_CLOPD|nr:thiamine pyrophosphokinase [[Clostridium] paradoxum JW-YL-7 = DSM 7308]SHK96115.1 thiamine pyrophosphokinase [[Clostridium] paradoxum JW-YL-7 = DSM 7308]